MTKSKHFDEIIRDKGGKMPYPVMEEWHMNVNDAIREMRAEMTELEWNGEHEAVQRKMPWFRFLQGEKKRGIVRIRMGYRPVRELR